MPNHPHPVRAGLKMSAHFLTALGLAAGALIAPAAPTPVAEAAPLPTVSVTGPATVFIGEAFTLNVQFANPSGIPTDVGFGPFVDLLIPYNGADGAAGADIPDGVSFVNASYLGQPVTAVVIPLVDVDGVGPGTLGVATHPYAFTVGVDGKGRLVKVPASVTGTAGDRLVVLQLPFGSFVPGQTPVDITVGLTLSNLADLNTPLPIRYRGGYMYGATALDDWCCDPAILSAGMDSMTWPATSITPVLFSMRKTNPMPENETATGPNFPRTYIVNIDVPTGQLVTALMLTDTLPDNAAYLTGTVASTPAGSVLLDQPLTPGAQAPPNNDLRVIWPITITGAAGADTDTRFNFFYPRVDAAGAALINPLTGGCDASVNTAQSALTWVPVDPRDGLTPISATVTAPSVSACSLVTQKAMSVLTDTGAAGPTPGDVVRVTLDFQVSDFFALNAIVLTDTLSDGLRYRAATAPTLQVAGNGFALGAAAINTANLTVIDHWTGAPAPAAPLTGATEVVFRVSDELVSRGRPDGNLLGGCVSPAGSATPDCAAYNDGATTGQIVFEAVILDEFTDTFPSGDDSVDHGDVLTNTLLINGAVLTTTAGFAPTGFAVSNPSAAQLAIAFGGLTKSLYAIGGNTSFGTPEIAPGITVTYRLSYTMPSSDFENTRVTDYLPLPVFRAGEIVTHTLPITSAGLPAAGQWKFGPADTLYAISGIVPTFTTNSTANTLTWDFGTYDDPLNRDSVIDLLFTVTTDDDPFADGLFLTNQANVFEGTTNAGSQETNAIIGVRLREPLVLFNKGVVAAENANATFAPAPPGPVAFTAPGTAGPRWTGTINSTNLATLPINSGVAGVDAGDRVTFALVIENEGLSPNGAFDLTITDTLPAGFVIPVGGLNLRAALGDGTVVGVTGLGGGPDGLPNTADDVFGAGLQLVDNPTVGACQKYDPSNGRNIVVITYDLQVDSVAGIGGDVINTGALTRYAGTEGGPNHVNSPVFEEALTSVRRPSVGKTLTGSTLTSANNTAVQGAIGEVLTYTLAISVPEGTLHNAVITDTLDAGLALVEVTGVSASAAVTTSLSGGFPAVLNAGTTVGSNPLVSGGGTVAVFDLGTLRNSDTDNAITETVTLTYTAVVLNQAGNDRGDTLNNAAQLVWTAVLTPGITSTVQSLAPVSAANLTLVEPTLLTSKTVTPATADGGDLITYTVRITNTAPGNTEAYSVVLTDVVPAGLTYEPGSLVNVSGVAAALDDSGAPTLTATWPSLALNAVSTLQFSARLNPTVLPAAAIVNTVNAQWSSLPGTVLTSQSPYSPAATERTGHTGDPGGAENDYRATGAVTVTVQTVTPVKTVVTTSEAHTSGNTVAVGEIVRYRLQVRVPEATANNFQLRDALPNGLVFLDDGTARAALVATTSLTASLVSGAGLNVAGDETTVNAITPTFVLPDDAVSSSETTDNDTYTSGADVSFKFGTLVNADSDTNQEFIIVEFNALVDNTSTGSNDAGDTQQNSFRARHDPGTGLANLGASVNAPTLTVVEPQLTVTKGASPGTGDAGDTIAFTIALTNINAAISATAFETVITDILPSTYVLNLPITVTLGGGAAGAVVGNVGNALTVTVDTLPVGGTVQVAYTADVLPTAAPGEVLTNTARLLYTSLPVTGTPANGTGSVTPGGSGAVTGERNGSGGVNDHTASATATVTITGQAVVKTLTGTSAAHTAGAEVTIGEVLTYSLAITLPEGATPTLVVTDVLPSGLQYVPGSASVDVTGFNGTAPAPVITGGLANGDDVVFTFGAINVTTDNVPGNNGFRLALAARVTDVPGNSGLTPPGQTTLANTAQLRAGAAPVTNANTVTATVVEPRLVVGKDLAPALAAPNDTVTATLTVTNTGTSTAFEVIVEDALANLVYGNLTPVSTPAGFSFAAVPSGGDTIARYTGGDLAVGASATFVFTATLAGDLTSGTVITNVATATQATTLPGPEPTERTEPPVDGVDTLTVIAPDLRVTKTDGLTSVATGQVVTYTLTYTNTGLRAAEGVVITETVPANAAFHAAASLPTVWSCADGAPAGAACTTAIGDVAAGASGTVTFAITVDAVIPAGVSTLTNTARIADDGAHGADPTPGNNLTSEVDTLTAAPDLAIVKTDGGVTRLPGETVTYTLTYTNTGDQAATGVVVTETVPANAAFNAAASLPTVWSCADGAPAGAACTVTVGNLAVGASGALGFAVVIAEPFPAGVSAITNTTVIADDGTNGPEPTPGNNTSTETTPVNNTADLQVVKTDDPDPVVAGTTLTYTVVATNLGPARAYNVTVTDTLPANVTLAAASPAPATGPTPLTWTAATLNVGEALTYTVVVTVDHAFTGVLTNTAQVGAATPDPTPGNNTDSEPTTVVAADLQIVKTDGAVTAVPGGVVTYTLTYTNTGGANATGVIITETVPANTTFSAAASLPTVWSCADGAPAGTVCALASGDVAVGAGGSVTFAVRVDTPAPAGLTQLTNTVVIADDGTHGADPTPGNNTSTEPTPLAAAPDLVIVKRDAGAATTAGSVLTYTLAYTNTGDQAATGVVVTETVPANTAFNAAASLPTVWSCADGAPAGTACTLALGAVASGGGGAAVFGVTVAPALPAGVTDLTNTAVIGDDGTNGPEPTPGNNTSTETTPVEDTPDLELVKTDGGVSVLPGAAITYTLAYSNTGRQAATGVTITETVPVGAVFNAALSTPGWTCADASPAGTPCGLSLGGVAAGAAGSVTFAITATDPLPTAITAISNTAVIGDDGTNGPEPTPGNNLSTETTPFPRLTLEKTASLAQAAESQPITYTLRITNTGSVAFTALTLTDTLPADFNFLPGSGLPGDPDVVTPPTLVWSNLGPLAVGQSLTVTFGVTASPAALGTFINVAEVAGLSAAGVVTATDDAPVAITDPSVQVDKRLTGADVDLSAPNLVTFTIQITNTGPSVIDVLPLVDVYTPTNLSFVSASVAPDDLVDDGLLHWSDLTTAGPGGFGANLAPGQSFVLVTVFRVVQDITSTTNTAQVVDAVDEFSNEATDVSDAVVIVNVPTAVTLTEFKVAVVQGQTVTLAWRTASEVDHLGFRLYRAPANDFGQAEAVGFVPASAAGAQGAAYTYNDVTPAEGVWWYWLADVDTAGQETLHGPVTTQLQPVAAPVRIFLPLIWH